MNANEQSGLGFGRNGIFLACLLSLNRNELDNLDGVTFESIENNIKDHSKKLCDLIDYRFLKFRLHNVEFIGKELNSDELSELDHLREIWYNSAEYLNRRL